MLFIKRFYYYYLLKRYAIKHELWMESTEDIQLLRGLDTMEKTRLRELSSLFIYYTIHDQEYPALPSII